VTAHLLDDEMLNFLKGVKEGLFQFEIGVQSTNMKTLEAVGRKTNLSKLKKVTEEIKSYNNIHQHLDLIAGLPGESYETFKKSFNDVYYLQPEKLQLGFLKLLRGSGLRQDAQKYGLVYQEQAPYEILYTDDLSYGELLQLKMIEEMVEIYYNGGKFLNSMRYLGYYFPTPFQMYEALSIYWEEQNYHAIQHNKYQLYKILFDFFQHTQERVDVSQFKEVLLFDMYLQENVKTRSEWNNPSIDPMDKDKIRDFFKDEGIISTYLPQLVGYNSRQISRMAHIEIFQYDWIDWMQQQENQMPMKKKTAILFNYHDRSHVLGQAACYKVELI
ncbi:MAG: DUF4080 domain-containing protein, partial [Epulopiscium sp.]|nr:DUF4080 domain-containing protein [Candidatus Epulonipiscium sp.]